MIYQLLCLVPVVTHIVIDLAFCLLREMIKSVGVSCNFSSRLVVAVLCQKMLWVESLCRFVSVDWFQFRIRQLRCINYFCKKIDFEIAFQILTTARNKFNINLIFTLLA